MHIGVIGGGQLAQMMALAGYPLGLKVTCLEPTVACSAGLVTDVIVGEYDDIRQLKQLADQTDVLTYEFENISYETLAQLDRQHQFTPKRLYPTTAALRISQDRLQEKQFFEALQIPTTRYLPIDSLLDLQAAITQIGLPAILKTRRFGYDGKGQQPLTSPEDLSAVWATLENQACLLENKVSFDREISCIGVRNIQGEIRFYALTENQHKSGILHLSRVTAQQDPMTALAQTYVTRILTQLDYVGVLTVEFFEQAGQLIANEIAPRVQNSGHWTIEGADTSQFENHLRAICGLPLGATETRGQVAMLNLVGEIPPLEKMLSIPNIHVHLYGKTPRARRKLGHVTICAASQEMLNQRLTALLKII
jgi:5-(carboxyamino)imidazole ribonucleotide synthase